MFADSSRETFYAEANEGQNATRMITSDRYKLIWYPYGNNLQLFDLKTDPNELDDIFKKEAMNKQVLKLKKALIDNLYGEDKALAKNGKLVGIKETVKKLSEEKTGLGLLGERELLGQRGLHYPPPPIEKK